MRAALATASLWLLVSSPAAVCAQVDPSGSWRTWRTAHFRVHAKAELASWAVEAAAEAERAHDRLSRELRPPRGIVDLVLSDDADYSNGFASVVPTNRITVYLTPPGPTVSLARYDGWLRLVITHELAHIFHLDRADGVWGLVQSVLGRAPGLFPNAYQPSWVVEGIATYYESRFTTAGRLRGAYHDQLLAATAGTARWPAPGDAVFTNPTWPAGGRAYAWGSRLFGALGNVAGDSAVPRFVDRTSRQTWPLNVSRPLRTASGESLQTLWGRLRDSANTAPGSPPDVVLVRGLRAEPLLRVSADGRYLVYRHSDDRGVPHVIVMDPIRRRRLAAHRANAVQGLAWAGDTVYVTQLDFVNPVRVVGDVYRWIPGRNWSRLTTDARAVDVVALADTTVAVVEVQRGRRALVSRVATIPGSTSMVEVPPASDWGRVAVSPDGQMMAGARHHAGRWDIVMWSRAEPHRVKAVTNDPYVDGDPWWSADGRLLLASERHGLPQVFRYDPTTESMEQLTEVVTGAREPALLADGALVYSTVLADGHAILAATLGSARPAVAAPVPARRFASAPDVRPSEGPYAPWGGLRPSFWIPIAHGERNAGTFLGVLSRGEDVIGRTAWAAFASVAPENGRWEGVLSIGHSRWRSWSVDVTGGQTWDFGGFARSVDDNLVPVSLRERAAEVGLRYRWRRWRTSAAWRVGTFLEQDALVNDGNEALEQTPANRTFAGSVISGGVSYAQRPPLAISRENGVSLSGLVLRRWQIGGSGWSSEFRGGLSGYVALPLPGFAHWVVAGHASIGVTGGPTPTAYSLGGESGDALDIIPGYTLGSGRRKFPLRGYDRGSDRFTRAFVGVLELRIPLAVIGKGVWRLPLVVDRLSFTTFGEVGGGWDRGEPAAWTAYRDVGGELVLDMGVGGLALRVRAGAAVALTEGLGSGAGDGRLYLALGSSF